MNYTELIKLFLEVYGGQNKGIRIFEAPARINLIGEHIDYNGGHVFPVSLELKNIVVARPNRSNIINLAVTSLPDRVAADINNLENYKKLHWGSYQCGVAYTLQQAGYSITGSDMLYHGTVPYGAGLSSSASIEVASAIAFARLGGREELDLKEIAILSQKAENEYIGMKCGIMDQFVSAFGKKDHAIFLNCSSLDYEYVPLNIGNNTIIIMNTNAPHKLTDSQYNQRWTECGKALEIINENGGNYKNLCSISVVELNKYERFFSDKVLYKRAKHCATEEARTIQSLAALKKGDIKTFGNLLCEANISMRNDYEATGKELDTAFDIAIKIDGVIGSRMTGGGFGGCNISIVKNDNVNTFKQIMIEEYTRLVGYAPSFYQSVAGEGAREVTKWL
jgi:galactokinase